MVQVNLRFVSGLEFALWRNKARALPATPAPMTRICCVDLSCSEDMFREEEEGRPGRVWAYLCPSRDRRDHGVYGPGCNRNRCEGARAMKATSHAKLLSTRPKFTMSVSLMLNILLTIYNSVKP